MLTGATSYPELERDSCDEAVLYPDVTTAMVATDRCYEPPRPRSAPIRITSDPKDQVVDGLIWDKLLYEKHAQCQYAVIVHVKEVKAELSQIGFPGDATIASAPWPSLWQRTEPDPRVWRGVFAVEYQHRTLFTQQVELKLDSLPRYQPEILITRRMLESDDE